MVNWKARGSLFGAFLGAVLAAAPQPVVAANGMKTGAVTSQPIGHYEFCKANISECTVRPRDRQVVSLTPKMWKHVVAVNETVNRAIRPMVWTGRTKVSTALR